MFEYGVLVFGVPFCLICICVTFLVGEDIAVHRVKHRGIINLIITWQPFDSDG